MPLPSSVGHADKSLSKRKSKQVRSKQVKTTLQSPIKPSNTSKSKADDTLSSSCSRKQSNLYQAPSVLSNLEKQHVRGDFNKKHSEKGRQEQKQNFNKKHSTEGRQEQKQTFNKKQETVIRVSEPHVETLCRICQDCEDSYLNQQVRACACDGSARYVHISCLQKWRQLKFARGEDASRCELCKSKYEVGLMGEKGALLHNKLLKMKEDLKDLTTSSIYLMRLLEDAAINGTNR